MTKRLVDIDDDLLHDARRVLGTATMKDTVHRALQDAVASSARREFVEDLTAGGLPDLRDPAVMADAWR